MTTPEEREVLEDEQAGTTATGVTLEDTTTTDAEQEQEESEEPAKTEYIEFLGTDKEYGTTFYAAGVIGHTITRRHLKEYHGVETPKDLGWMKMAGGKHRGRMLLEVSAMSPEAAEVLENDPMFKRVSL